MLASLAALPVARGFAQPPVQPPAESKPVAGPKPAEKPAVAARRLNLITLSVTDLKRSAEFYQDLFGLSSYVRTSSMARLRVGAGPQSLEIVESKAARPAITQFGLSVEKFDAAAVSKQLEDFGVTKAAGPGAPLTDWIKQRGDTPELFVADPDGLIVQLQDTSYCGGAGALGNRCSAEIAPKRGLLRMRDLSHFTIRVGDVKRSRDFYQQTFGMGIQAYQGENAPILGVGTSRHFVMSIAAGGGRGTPAPAADPSASANPPAAAPATPTPAARPVGIDHGCFLVEAFDVDRIFKFLSDFGLKPRGDTPGPAQPMTYYVTKRMENRGGAPGGTPELYFTDPDGILLQLQDVSYCGGGGLLGSVCL